MKIQKFNVFFEDDSDLAEWEAKNRGWRNDVYVSINDELFHLNIYTPIRLCQDFETEIKEYGYYAIDYNIVLVPSADKSTIILTIQGLIQQGYFQKIKPQNDSNVARLKKL